ncbi:hypothetical protein LPB248_00775 [Flavobacterium sp. LPB0248]|nr:hypothetical protein [Flavobacterium sp. LPB0248]QLC64862.1 hypothetical protein LPB248_00775 [Flavobacterium sp. LPB0248]
MSLANAQTKLTRNEMKIIMAGSGSGPSKCYKDDRCPSGYSDGWFCIIC